jgi:hypothetical protein
MTNTTLTQILDHAALQNDRWLFLALMAIGLIASFYLFRWLVGQYTSQSTKLTEVVERNTIALGQIKGCVQQVSQEIMYCRMKNEMNHGTTTIPKPNE